MEFAIDASEMGESKPLDTLKFDKEYSLLVEINESECENVYYFISKMGKNNEGKYVSNEKNLLKLENIINSVDDWIIEQDKSIFIMDNFSSIGEQTAKEMSLLRINPQYKHRKFDGVLSDINFGISNERDSDKIRINKIRDKLSFGKISRYIDNEDILTSDEDSQSFSTEPPIKKTKKNKFQQLRKNK